MSAAGFECKPSIIRDKRQAQTMIDGLLWCARVAFSTTRGRLPQEDLRAVDGCGASRVSLGQDLRVTIAAARDHRDIRHRFAPYQLYSRAQPHRLQMRQPWSSDSASPIVVIGLLHERIHV